MDKRLYARQHLVLYLDVIDQHTNQLLGHLGDISKNGIMFITEKFIPPEQLISIKIELPAGEFAKDLLEMQVETRWVKPNINPELHCIGCAFAKIAPDDLVIIHQVGDAFSFHDDIDVTRVAK